MFKKLTDWLFFQFRDQYEGAEHVGILPIWAFVCTIPSTFMRIRTKKVYAVIVPYKLQWHTI
eukprot:scaffold1872_cov262-Amphora_coffeaeformis.AAC.12